MAAIVAAFSQTTCMKFSKRFFHHALSVIGSPPAGIRHAGIKNPVNPVHPFQELFRIFDRTDIMKIEKTIYCIEEPKIFFVEMKI